MRRWIKVVVGALLASSVIGTVVWEKVISLPKNNKSVVRASHTGKSSTLARPNTDRHVAAIVNLDVHGITEQTLNNLAEMHADTVYLYVAYWSDAYFQIPQNPYGLANPIDALKSAISTLHDHGYKVIAVISSALLHPPNVTPAGYALLQPHSDIIDPKAAMPLVVSLVQNLMNYPVDGIYVGEPYFTKGIPHPTEEQKLEWDRLYQAILDVTKPRNIPVIMVLPDLYAEGISTIDQSGLPEDFTSLPFTQIGIDLEDSYEGYWNKDLLRYQNALAKLDKIAAGRPKIVELSLRKGYAETPVPPQFFAKEVQIADQHNVQTLLIFAESFWANSPYKKEYAQSLSQWLRSES